MHWRARFKRWLDRWLARTQTVTLMSKTDPPEPAEIRPKRGGVSVNLVAIAWEPIKPIMVRVFQMPTAVSTDFLAVLSAVILVVWLAR